LTAPDNMDPAIFGEGVAREILSDYYIKGLWPGTHMHSTECFVMFVKRDKYDSSKVADEFKVLIELSLPFLRIMKWANVVRNSCLEYRVPVNYEWFEGCLEAAFPPVVKEMYAKIFKAGLTCRKGEEQLAYPMKAEVTSEGAIKYEFAKVPEMVFEEERDDVSTASTAEPAVVEREGLPTGEDEAEGEYTIKDLAVAINIAVGEKFVGDVKYMRLVRAISSPRASPATIVDYLKFVVTSGGVQGVKWPEDGAVPSAALWKAVDLLVPDYVDEEEEEGTDEAVPEEEGSAAGPANVRNVVQ